MVLSGRGTGPTSKRNRPVKTALHRAPVQAFFETVSSLLDRTASSHGWQLRRRKKKVPYSERAAQFEYYWYNAWKKIDVRDIEGFGALASKAIEEHRTGMRYDRLYTLWQAIAAVQSDAPLAEVGVYRGGSSRFLLEALRFHRRANRLYACDTFSGHAEVDEQLDGPHRVDLQFTNTSVEDVREHLRDFPNVELVHGDFRETSGKLAHIQEFSFVHVDVDVYPVTRYCLEFFAPRVRPGSFIVVDDYGFSTCRGARQAVEEFVAESPHFRKVHLLTGQALLVRVAGN
jgi:O-methyltransferase